MPITRNQRSQLIGADHEPVFSAKVTSFTSSTNYAVPSKTTSVTYLVVAGGGAGGFFGGGGGAGGYRSSTPGEASGGGASAEPALTVTAGSTIPVVVGAGGADIGGHNIYNKGSDSSFGPITSEGGGSGGGRFAYIGPADPGPAGRSQLGQPGGSGGGSGIWYGVGGPGSDVAGTGPYPEGGGLGTANQGFPSGLGRNPSSNYGCAVGGGGAGEAGQKGNPDNVIGGRGGQGVASSITGSPVAYADGGGGAAGDTTLSAPNDKGGAPGPGGTGGTGYGSGSDPSLAATEGTVNRGGGGGGGAYGPSGASRTGQAGGSGFVAVNDPNGGFSASSVWNLRRVFELKKDGDWI
tara:strand:- start:1814 stop:2863 length:1050 start_codon:yes stop_codon:yes gene_type:complete